MPVGQPPSPGAARPSVETGGLSLAGVWRRRLSSLGTAAESLALAGRSGEGGALARSLRVRGSATWCGGTRYGGGEGPRGRGVQQHPKGLGHRRVGLSACKGKIRISQFR